MNAVKDAAGLPDGTRVVATVGLSSPSQLGSMAAVFDLTTGTSSVIVNAAQHFGPGQRAYAPIGHRTETELRLWHSGFTQAGQVRAGVWV